MIPLPAHAHALNDLVIRRVAPEIGGQFDHRIVDLLRALAEIAGDPVLLARQIDHHAADTLGNICIELYALIRIKAVDGLEQRQNALVDDVIHLSKAAVNAADLQCHTFDQSLVTQDDCPLERLVPIFFITLQKLLCAEALNVLSQAEVA